MTNTEQIIKITKHIKSDQINLIELFLFLKDHEDSGIRTRAEYEEILELMNINANLVTYVEDQAILPNQVIVEYEDLPIYKEFLLQKIFDLFGGAYILHTFSKKI